MAWSCPPCVDTARRRSHVTHSPTGTVSAPVGMCGTMRKTRSVETILFTLWGCRGEATESPASSLHPPKHTYVTSLTSLPHASGLAQRACSTISVTGRGMLTSPGAGGGGDPLTLLLPQPEETAGGLAGGVLLPLGGQGFHGKVGLVPGGSVRRRRSPVGLDLPTLPLAA